MDMIKESAQKYNKLGIDINVNLTKFGILLFTFVFSSLQSFMFSYKTEVLLLFFSLVIILFSRTVINKKDIMFSTVDIMWLLFFMLFVTNIVFNNNISSRILIDILFYLFCVVFLILVKVDIKNYLPSLKLIKTFGLIYAGSAIFQYLYTDVYLSYILPLFPPDEQSSILKLLSNNSYAGLTNQTAHIAGYIVNGIGIIVFSNWNKKLSNKVLKISFLCALFVALLLTAKRAHLIFMLVSVVFTYLLSIDKKVFTKKILNFILIGILFVSIVIFLFNNFNENEDSPIVNFVNELEHTVYGIIEGEDVTSGRITLYSYSWELFKERPIVGIGWKEFINLSIGLINPDRGSHPHNIYLQLLTELGILGFLLFMIPVLYLYYQTYRVLRLVSIDKVTYKSWKLGIQFSFYSQTFFILYGITGNLLTDFNFLLMYFFACSISVSAIIQLKDHPPILKQNQFN